MSHTYAVLQISKAAFDEIKGRFEEAEYRHAFDSDAEGGLVVDMHGTAVQALPPAEADLDKFNFSWVFGKVVASDDNHERLANLHESFRVGLDELCKRHHVRLMHGRDEDELKIVVDCEPGFDEPVQAEWGELACELKPSVRADAWRPDF